MCVCVCLHMQSLLISWTASNTNSLKAGKEKIIGVFFRVCYLHASADLSLVITLLLHADCKIFMETM